MNEIWLPAHTFEDRYEVSNLGRLRNLPRVERILNRWGTFTNRPIKGGKIIKPNVKDNNYLFYCLKIGNKTLNRYAHRLVASTFICPQPEWARVVNHIDHNRQNNHVDNLEWVTQSQNMLSYFARPEALKWSRHKKG